MAFRCFAEAIKNFVALITNKVDTLQSLLDQGNTICGSSGDLILMTNPAYGITLYDLCTKAVVNIPPIPCLKTKMNHVIHKAASSSSFTGSSHNVMVIYGEEKALASYSLETKIWSLMEKAGTSYDDVICYEEQFYAVDEYGKVVNYQLEDGCHYKELVNRWCFFGQKVYLVVVDEGLLLVVRYVGSGDSDSCRRTKFFKVYVLMKSFSFKGVKKVKEWAILVSKNQAVAVLARECEGVKASCIYFRDDCEDLNGSEMRVFSMDEQFIQVLQGDDADKLNVLWQELYLSS